MKVLVLNGSPKKRGSTSGLLGRIMGCFLTGCQVQYASIRTKNEYAAILPQLNEIDALVLAVPLYVDGIPSHVLEFLEAAERFCMENNCRFSFYVISNNGFIEGIHNRVHLKMYECWCRRTAVTWGGGIGIGGGEMLYVLSIYFPVMLAVYLGINLVKYISGTPVTFSGWLPLLENAAVYLFFHCGIFYCMLRLAAGIRKLREVRNRYTRVMVPALLFIPMADIFMALSALFNGKIIFFLLKKDIKP